MRAEFVARDRECKPRARSLTRVQSLAPARSRERKLATAALSRSFPLPPRPSFVCAAAYRATLPLQSRDSRKDRGSVRRRAAPWRVAAAIASFLANGRPTRVAHLLYVGLAGLRYVEVGLQFACELFIDFRQLRLLDKRSILALLVHLLAQLQYASARPLERLEPQQTLRAL